MKTKKIEVLAPAGNPAALKAAVFAGADAVYMGGSLFSARASAVNFSREEMREAVLFARERNVRVYVTVNTLLKDDELPEALDFCKFLCSVPVDGILIQDMGLFNILREACPEMPLHASTQMSLHTPGGAALLKELGASRVVLAREMSLKEIEEVSKKTDVELEAFVHGALCMSLSGQCYFSAMLGGRSGNRGRCAQTCRLPFAAPGGTGHDLSLKDMSFIDHIETLHNAGVCSAKIDRGSHEASGIRGGGSRGVPKSGRRRVCAGKPARTFKRGVLALRFYGRLSVRAQRTHHVRHPHKGRRGKRKFRRVRAAAYFI